MVKVVVAIALVGVPEMEPVAEFRVSPVAAVISGLVVYVIPTPVGNATVGPASAVPATPATAETVGGDSTPAVTEMVNALVRTTAGAALSVAVIV